MMSRRLSTSGTSYDSTSRRMRLAGPLAGARGCQLTVIELPWS